MSCIVKLADLTKRYENVAALDNVNLAVRRNEILTVIGPNGSGKTTLLRMMAFLDKPTEGEILFNDTRIDYNNRGHIRTKCTMVFQKTALFDTTVGGNISYGLNL